MVNIHIDQIEKSRRNDVDFNNLVFGAEFTDHMLLVEYRNDRWGTPHIKPYGPIPFEPGMSVLHYGQTIFEGQKAFFTADDRINVFRMDKNFERLNKSARRMCIPEIPEEIYYEGLKQLVLLDKEWIPRKKGESLYIRPFVFATESFLGVRPATSYLFMIILSPVGPYYKEGFNPVKLTTSGGYVRAVSGGVGNAKTAANYAASLYPAQLARKKGFSQMLWLDAKEHRYIEEVGTMNIFIYLEDGLITPPLDDGTILPGITRESVIQLARDMDVKVCERRITIDEVFEANEKGQLKEIFGSGTAAVISPVGELVHQGRKIVINNGETGEFAKKMFDIITGIQYGERDDPYHWCFYLS